MTITVCVMLTVIVVLGYACRCLLRRVVEQEDELAEERHARRVELAQMTERRDAWQAGFAEYWERENATPFDSLMPGAVVAEWRGWDGQDGATRVDAAKVGDKNV